WSVRAVCPRSSSTPSSAGSISTPGCWPSRRTRGSRSWPGYGFSPSSAPISTSSSWCASGGLKNAAAAGSRQVSDDGLTPEEQLDAISIRMRPLLERQARCLADVLLPELAARGIRILRWPELDEPQRRSLRRHFVEQIFPVLTPQAITRAPGHPFPLVANLRLSLAALVRDPRSGPDHFAYFKLPESLPRFVPLSESREFVPLEDVVRANLDVLYPGREVRAAHCFRVTRSGDLALEEESAASLLLAIEEQAKRRPYGAAVRLEVERATP